MTWCCPEAVAMVTPPRSPGDSASASSWGSTFVKSTAITALLRVAGVPHATVEVTHHGHRKDQFECGFRREASRAKSSHRRGVAHAQASGARRLLAEDPFIR